METKVMELLLLCYRLSLHHPMSSLPVSVHGLYTEGAIAYYVCRSQKASLQLCEATCIEKASAQASVWLSHAIVATAHL